jgi:hypothetical protein
MQGGRGWDEVGGGLGLGKIGQVAAADLTGESPTNGEKRNKRKKM